MTVNFSFQWVLAGVALFCSGFGRVQRVPGSSPEKVSRKKSVTAYQGMGFE